MFIRFNATFSYPAYKKLKKYKAYSTEEMQKTKVATIWVVRSHSLHILKTDNILLNFWYIFLQAIFLILFFWISLKLSFSQSLAIVYFV